MSRETKSKDFQLSDIDETAIENIVVHCGLLPLTARVLVARDIATPEDAELFMHPSLERDWRDPALIPGLCDVADKVLSTIKNNGRILVFGDFDVDGITATAISVRGLRALGADAVGLIPHRYEEGYALSKAAVRRGMTLHPDLVMTVDCGISCGQEVAAMRACGIDVAITDHHEPGENVPRGVPVADPKIDPNCPSRDLAGAGVALKLVCMLGQRLGKPDLWTELLDFAALGTIADLMPLTDENRALVAAGIKRINNTPRPCIEALATICNVQSANIDSVKLSFSLIPRINAAGRMGDATIALDLLLSDSMPEAATLAEQLDSINTERRRVEAELEKQVDECLAEKFHGQAVIVVAGKGWHEGVKGIVASRIARTYKRPTIIFSIDGDIARGSGRTYNGVNLFELTNSVSELFDKFGGHAAAIGITMTADKIDELREKLCARVDEFVDERMTEGQRIDTQVKLSECTLDAFKQLDKLQPFGNTNPVPLLKVEDVFLEHRKAVGKNGSHLSYQASDGLSQVSGIFFSLDNIDEMLACESACDIIFEPNVDSYVGRPTPQLMTRKIIVHACEYEKSAKQKPKSELEKRLTEIFAHDAQTCERGEYAGITQAAYFNTKVVGVSFENRQSVLSTLQAGTELSLVREPDNAFDPNAIAVLLLDGTQIGFLNRHLAARLCPVMDSGVPYDAMVSTVTGGPSFGRVKEQARNFESFARHARDSAERNWGVNIIVRRKDLDAPDLCEQGVQTHLDEKTKQHWCSLAPSQLDDRLREELVGDHELHKAQAQALSHLARGLSTLLIMATGRGKSLVFHLHAARSALVASKASIFVYPLRALVADQAFHLRETYERFGLCVRVLTGETDMTERDEIYAGLRGGTVDVVLTTPEFVVIHADKLAATQRVGFVVVDEAHHIGQSKAGNRPAYVALSEALVTLNNPLVLAATATADDETARCICDTLKIRRLVMDPTVRENLHIDDARDLRERDNYLASIVASGDKCVVYVNSRDQSTMLCRMLRHRLPKLAGHVAFYHAGLSKSDRKLIENAFRSGELSCIISTSAFGEGVDIGDIEHVVLYHLPFNEVEFNQMSGRAGRNGRDAQVHLLYGYKDARINENILSSSAPSHRQMAALYKALREQAREAAMRGEDGFSLTNMELSDKAACIDKRVKLDESAASCAIAVFRELGFIKTSGQSVARYIRMVDGPKKMELTDSVRYREGLEELDEFRAFKHWALGATSEKLLERFNRPILPEHPEMLVGA